jgi:Leucine-rich repeat (LRR) protein
MIALKELYANGTAIKQLPYSFGLLKNLKTLSLSGCKGQFSRSWLSWFMSWISSKFTKPIYLLPTSIFGLCSLRQLDLSGCNLFEDGIPFDMGSLPSLQQLDLSRNNFRTLPHSIGRLPQLRRIYVNECASLESISELPASLRTLFARGCSSLQRLPDGLNQESLWAYLYKECCHNLAYDLRKSLLQVLSLSLSLSLEPFYDVNFFSV